MTGEQAGFRQSGAESEMTGTIGVISDTHGLLRPEALEALRGCERIIHAGDVGSADVLSQLRDLAPVVAVRGNVDSEAWAMRLPRTATVKIGSHTVYVLHVLEDLEIEPSPAGISAVVYGHSHKPSIEERDGVIYLNPGSAGPRRFRLPIGVGYLHLESGGIRGELLDLG